MGGFLPHLLLQLLLLQLVLLQFLLLQLLLRQLLLLLKLGANYKQKQTVPLGNSYAETTETTQVSYAEFLGAPHCLVKNTVALREG